MILEFGVYTGGTTSRMAEQFSDKTIYAFDWFNGLPEDWAWRKKGELSLNGKPPESLPQNVELVVGRIEETLPTFLDDHVDQLVDFAHIDVDVYSTSAFILQALGDRLNVGSIVVFDEYRGYAGSEEYEFKAFQEFLQSNPECDFEEINLGFELGFAQHEQAAFELMSNDR
jgi:predicted O-methyltransferase YrrM